MTGHENPHDDANADPASRHGRGSAETPAAEGWFGTMRQLDFDIDFFESLLCRNPGSIDVLRVLAELVSQKGLVARAVELDHRLVQALPNDFLARYNLACSLARAGRPDEAIDSLTRAILLGYDDIAHLETDPDLDSLRDLPDFQELLGHGRTA